MLCLLQIDSFDPSKKKKKKKKVQGHAQNGCIPGEPLDRFREVTSNLLGMPQLLILFRKVKILTIYAPFILLCVFIIKQ